MLIDHRREKLIQAVVFFAQNVRKLGKVKLFKLLYFLDFQHFRDTGKSVTGMDYHAWKMGPVPVALYGELDAPEPDWQGRVDFTWIKVSKGAMLSLKATSAFDPTHFSRRELRLLEELAREFRDMDSEDMIEATHLENLPWHKIWVEQGSKQALIPYELAARAQELETVVSLAAEHDLTAQALSK